MLWSIRALASVVGFRFLSSKVKPRQAKPRSSDHRGPPGKTHRLRAPPQRARRAPENRNFPARFTLRVFGFDETPDLHDPGPGRGFALTARFRSRRGRELTLWPLSSIRLRHGVVQARSPSRKPPASASFSRRLVSGSARRRAARYYVAGNIECAPPSPPRPLFRDDREGPFDRR